MSDEIAIYKPKHRRPYPQIGALEMPEAERLYDERLLRCYECRKWIKAKDWVDAEHRHRLVHVWQWLRWRPYGVVRRALWRTYLRIAGKTR